MDPLERLADYLAGELDADEHAAVEAQLTRDPGLRARLAALRRADAALGGLTSPEPPAGFEQRVRGAVDAELAARFTTTETTRAADAPAGVDQLAARRARRRPPLPALVGVAAAAVLLVAVAVSGDLLPTSTDEAAMDLDTADDAAPEMFAVPDAAEEPAEDVAVWGPTVVAAQRILDDDDLEDLLATPELGEVTARRLQSTAGASVAGEFAHALRAFAAAAADVPVDDAEPAEETADEPAVDLGAEVRQHVAGDATIDAADREDIARCLETLEVEDEPAVPAYVELATYAGEGVVVYGLVSTEPATGAFTRTEIWVVAREDCQLRQFLPS